MENTQIRKKFKIFFGYFLLDFLLAFKLDHHISYKYIESKSPIIFDSESGGYKELMNKEVIE